MSGAADGTRRGARDGFLGSRVVIVVDALFTGQRQRSTFHSLTSAVELDANPCTQQPVF